MQNKSTTARKVFKEYSEIKKQLCVIRLQVIEITLELKVMAQLPKYLKTMFKTRESRKKTKHTKQMRIFDFE